MRRTSFRNNLAGIAIVAAVALLIAAGTYFLIGRHDLSGDYYKSYNTYFYIETVSFDDNGTFTMQTLGGYFYGKYFKKKGTYYLYPDSGTSDSPNPVTDVQENHMASEYYFTAAPIADDTLEITMWGRGDYVYYLPWSGKAALFYTISPEDTNLFEEGAGQGENQRDSKTVSDEPTKSTSMMDFYQEELEKEPENDIGRPPEDECIPWDNMNVEEE